MEHLIPPKLKTAIEQNKVVLFAGAGTSVPLGLPSWKDLVLQIIREIKKDTPEYAPFEQLLNDGVLTPLYVLDLLKVKHRLVIHETLEKEVGSIRNKDFSLHKKLLRISSKLITTNYDRAFERAVDDDIAVVLNDSKYSLAKIADRTHFLFKIHGDINVVDKCLLFEEEYKRLYQDNAFLLGLRILFIQQTILFVGCSLNDPYIEQLITSLNDMFDSFNLDHYIITTDDRFNEEKFRNKVKPILVENYDDDLHKLLDKLVDIKTGQQAVSVTEPVHNLVRRQFESLIGRNKQLKDILLLLQNEQTITSIIGPPGVGKTSIALETGYTCIGKSSVNVTTDILFPFVVWISASDFLPDEQYMNRIYDVIARMMGYVKITSIGTTEKIKESEVNDLLLKNSVLIIIDGFNSKVHRELENWIRNVRGKVKILLTTIESGDFQQNRYELSAFTEHDSYEYIQTEAQALNISLNELDTGENMAKLHQISGGMPQVLKLMLGHIYQKDFKLGTKVDGGSAKSDYDDWYKNSWEKLDENERNILLLFPVIASNFAVHRQLLYFVSKLEYSAFNIAVSELCNWMLLTFNLADEKYTIHPTLVTFIKKKTPASFNSVAVKVRYIKYITHLVESTIKRTEPNEPYWNTLVSPKMNNIDKDWPVIYQALTWATNIPVAADDLVALVILLAHYMDSRFYNQERLLFVQAAIDICDRQQDDYYSALLRIDALGWTYVEEFELHEADCCIRDGTNKIADLPEDQKASLQALADAWLARVRIEQEDADDANRLIKKALAYKGNRWIQCRVFMSAGDIKFKLKEYKDALDFYKKAKQESDSYGGEGNDYQIKPRLGLTHLSLDNKAEAKEMFEEVKNYPEITIGKLYGEYGLALLHHYSGTVKDVNEEFKCIEDEIYKRSNSNLLLKLIEQYKKER